MLSNHLVFVAAGAATLALVPAAAQAQSISISAGAEFSSDGSGSDELVTGGDVWLVPFSARYSGENGSIGLSLAYAEIEGSVDANVLAPGQTPVRDIILRRGVEFVPSLEPVTGFTDLVISAERSFMFENPEWPMLSLSGSVKLPTASEEDGLSTGATDFSARAEIYGFVGEVMPYAYLGGRFRGEGENTQSSDSLEAGIGVQGAFTDTISWLASYDYRGASSDFSDEAHDITGMLSFELTDTVSLSTYAYTGFTDASPEIGLGFSVSRRFSWQ